MRQATPISQTDAGFAPEQTRAFPGRAWNLDSLSWLAPRVPLRQVICILGAGQGAVTEQFRVLHLRLERLREQRPLKTILIASSLPGEGRSFVTLNLAASMSQRGRNKVLVVEADLRRPSCCSALGVDAVPGLGEYCDSAAEVEQFVYRVSGLDLCLLPAGRPSGPPLEVLASRGMRKLLETARMEFDWLLVDSAPLAPVADSVLLSRLCDGVLLVVRHGTPAPALREALERIEPAKLLGLVLNEFSLASGCNRYLEKAADTASGETARLVDHGEAA